MRHKPKCESPGVPGRGFQKNTQLNQTGNQYKPLATEPGATSLEAWIRRLGVEIEIAMKHGRRDAACTFMLMMYAAIRARSPLQQHRRHMVIDAAIFGGPQ